MHFLNLLISSPTLHQPTYINENHAHHSLPSSPYLTISFHSLPIAAKRHLHSARSSPQAARARRYEQHLLRDFLPAHNAQPRWARRGRARHHPPPPRHARRPLRVHAAGLARHLPLRGAGAGHVLGRDARGRLGRQHRGAGARPGRRVRHVERAGCRR